MTKSKVRWLFAEIGWFIAEGGAGVASTYVPFDHDFWADKRIQRQTDRQFSVLMEELHARP